MPAEVALVRDWAATSWPNVIEGLLAENRCPACPGTELDPSTTVLFSRERTTGLPLLRGGVAHRQVGTADGDAAETTRS